jgi:hypothetical protein
VNLLGNLDCEARWAGVALPDSVARRISLYATLFAACAPDAAPHAIWVPAPIDPARLLAHPGWTPPVVHVLPRETTAIVVASGPRSARAAATDCGDSLPPALDSAQPAATAGPDRFAPPFDLAWAAPSAKAANDRADTLAIAAALGVALPGARLVASLAEIDDAAAGLAGRPWICKARWTAAGRDRALGAGPPEAELRARVARLLTRFGPLVFEPWLDRVTDLGVCGEVTATGDIVLREPHRIATDARGGFLGIELEPSLDRAIAATLAATARAAANMVADRTGYRGPFAVDAFVFRDARGTQELHPLCEFNARHSFGWIAWALAARLGARRLGFDAPPPGATVLIAPGEDRVTAWCA